MSLVMNECEWAEGAIASGKLGKNSWETLSRIAKYYFNKGKSRSEVRGLLEMFILKSSPGESVVKWDDMINKCMKYAEKHPAVMIDKLVITKPEISKINSLSGKQQRRLAFTLLCLSKYYNSVSDRYDSWVGTPDNEIMKMANINTSIKRQCLLFRQLSDAGMIKFANKIDNLSVRVLFEEQGETDMEITDLRNLGNQYLLHCGEPYYVCVDCGLVIKQDKGGHRPMKYCPHCAKIAQNNQKKEYDIYRRKTSNF